VYDHLLRNQHLFELNEAEGHTNKKDDMKTARSFVTVWMTVLGRPLAVKRSRLSVESGLSDCAQISGPLESMDRWQGVEESGKQWRVVFKTHSRLLSKREALVIANHPDDTLQFLVRPIVAGSKKYLDWLGECAGTPQKSTTRRRSKTH